MNYLISDRNTLVWFCFTVYVLTAVFLLPNMIKIKSTNVDISNHQAIQFATRFVLRLTLIFPMVFLLTAAI